VSEKEIKELMAEAARQLALYVSRNPLDTQFSFETGKKWIEIWLLENIGTLLK